MTNNNEDLVQLKNWGNEPKPTKMGMLAVAMLNKVEPNSKSLTALGLSKQFEILRKYTNPNILTVKDTSTGKVISSIRGTYSDVEKKVKSIVKQFNKNDVILTSYGNAITVTIEVSNELGVKAIVFNAKSHVKSNIVSKVANAGGTLADWYTGGLMSKITNMGKTIAGAYSGEKGTALRNMLPDSDENARPGFPGEHHALLKLPNGKVGVGNWIGPGTQVVKRLERKDPPRTPADAVAEMHDINYSLAKGEPTKEKQLQKVREADERMVKSLEKIEKEGGDSIINITIGLRLIQAKIKAEDLMILDKSKFTGEIGPIRKEDRDILLRNRTRLMKLGY